MRYNSTIKPIQGECCDCTDGKQKYLVSGRCDYHYKKHRASLKPSRDKRLGRINPLIKKPILVDALQHSIELEQWYKMQIIQLDKHPYCMECFSFIPPRFYKHAVAHIFPKAHFESVMTHPLNRLFLGSGCGCHETTHRLDKFSKMGVWKQAVHNFEQFEHLITETHKYLDLFKQYAYPEKSLKKWI